MFFTPLLCSLLLSYVLYPLLCSLPPCYVHCSPAVFFALLMRSLLPYYVLCNPARFLTNSPMPCFCLYCILWYGLSYYVLYPSVFMQIDWLIEYSLSFSIPVSATLFFSLLLYSLLSYSILLSLTLGFPTLLLALLLHSWLQSSIDRILHADNNNASATSSRVETRESL